MKLAVASGKGGTGKTTVTACLSRMWSGRVSVEDLDVEEPNLHLFLPPVISGEETATIEVPEVDQSLCTHCHACSDLCQFKAISDLGSFLLTFSEMCHGCGGCLMVCPAGALTPGTRTLGTIRWGYAGHAFFIEGRLRIGEAMSPPLIRAVKAKLAELPGAPDATVIIDAPPGVSCPAVSAVTDSDLIVLVTEPTPFGLYDLELAYQAFSPLAVPMSVVINRAGWDTDGVVDFCRRHHLPIAGRIPFNRRFAEAYSEGAVLVDAVPSLRPVFADIIQSLQGLVTTTNHRKESHHA